MMRCRFVLLIIVAALAAPAFGQNQQAPRIPRMSDGKPNLTGLWQTLGTANWDIRDHIAQPGPFFQLGAVGAMPVTFCRKGWIPMVVTTRFCSVSITEIESLFPFAT